MIREAAFYEELGLRILAKRRDRKVTQEKLAELVGLTRTSITNIEKGRQKVLAHVLLELAEALNTDVADLLPARRSPAVEVEALPTQSRHWIERTLRRKETR